MNCIKCELTRSKFKALSLVFLGYSLERIAEHLTVKYGEDYFVGYGEGKEASAIFRKNKLPPFEPFLIYERSNDERAKEL